jgi:hypothetical protein
VTISRLLIGVHDARWLEEKDSHKPGVVFYYTCDGKTGMVAVVDAAGDWWYFDLQDKLARDADQAGALLIADERWAMKSDDDIPF